MLLSGQDNNGHVYVQTLVCGATCWMVKLLQLKTTRVTLGCNSKLSFLNNFYRS